MCIHNHIRYVSPMLDKITNPPVRTFSSTNLRITISLLLVTGLLALTVSCDLFGGSDSEPKTGSVVVDVSTSGTDKDNNGYTVVLAADSQSVSATGKVTFSGLPTGDRELSIGGVAENCAIEGNNPRTLSVKAGQTVIEKVAITCSQKTGSVAVDVTTTGDDTDPDGYTLTVADRSQSVGPNGSVTFTDLPVGDHDLAVESIASNCSVDGANPRTVTVEDGQETTEAVTVSCSAETGSIAVSTATSGSDLDPDGYTVTLDNGSGRSIGTDDEITFSDVSAESHTVELSGLADNCITNGSTTRDVSVSAGETTSVSYAVTCSQKTGSVAVDVTTTGDDTDPDGYTLTVADRSQSVGPNGSVTFTDLPVGDHDLAVESIASNCSVDGANPRTVTVEDGQETTEAVTVSCSAETGSTGIVFDRLKTGEISSRDIWIMDADGSDKTALTDTGFEMSRPVWWPDGSKILFDNADESNLSTIKPDGSNLKNITPDLWTAVDPDIGPNGERIVARVQPESNDDADDLRLIDAQTGEIIRRLTYEGNVTRVPSSPEFSPDGSKVAFSSYRDGNWEIYVVNTDGSGEPTRLTNSSAGESTPAYSPNGSTIAFGRDDELWIMDADGSNQQMLVESGGGPAWSPDGQEIALVRQTSGTIDIYRMDADGSNVTPLVESDNWHESDMDWR